MYWPGAPVPPFVLAVVDGVLLGSSAPATGGLAATVPALRPMCSALKNEMASFNLLPAKHANRREREGKLDRIHGMNRAAQIHPVHPVNPV